MREDRFDRVVRALAGGGWRDALRTCNRNRNHRSNRHIAPPLLTTARTGPVMAFAGFTPAPMPDAFCPVTWSDAVGLDRITAAVARFAGTASERVCLSGDAPCAGDEGCCSGVCTMHGRCGCFEVGHLCPSDGYCCGGVCREHRCR